MKKIKTLLLLMCFLLVTGCFFGTKMTMLAATPGHLTSIKRIDNLDDRVPILLNKFAINLYDELYDEGRNLFISPASIYLALGMTYNGASGITATEMANVLGVSDKSLDDFNKISRDLQFLILGYEDSKFELANSIWIRDTYEDFVKTEFLNRNKDYYGAMISAMDFNDPKAKDTINKWVSKNTKGRIEKAIEENIHPLTVMFLINTIYFKTDWKTPFEKLYTNDGNFHTLSEIKAVKMMNKVDKIGYVEDDTLQGVMLPYKDNKTSMIVLLPKDDVSDINLNTDNLNALINTMKVNKKSVELSMPKIKMEYKASLKDSLSRLGMPGAFIGMADFSNMATNAREDGLHIADVTHKSFLIIDEKGTEAAAMTKVEMRLESASQGEYRVNVDHPFIFGIIDNNSGALLFLGNIFNP